MDHYLAAIYKKVKIMEDIYIYKFKEAVEVVEYDMKEDVIVYFKNGAITKVYNMEDPAFTVSDEKICFSDLMSKEQLKIQFNIEDDTKIKDIFIEECCSFIRYGIFDSNTDVLKVISTSFDDIKEAEPDTNFRGYQLTGLSDGGCEVTFPIETVKSMLKELELKHYNSLKDRLLEIIESESIIINKISEYMTENDKKDDEVKNEEINEKTRELENELNNLNQLIGLDEVKNEIQKLKKYLEFLLKTKDILTLENPNLNMVFSGNPGTGKTTIARIFAKILYILGYTENSKFKETTAQDFIAGYVGQTAIKSKSLITQNRGGVIFIDEAYVFSSGGQEFADEALVEIIKEMESKKTIFIFAGYTNEMERFIAMNPGIKSRIGYNIEFKDYSIEQLYEIFELKLKQANLKISEDAKNKVLNIIKECKKIDSFGNGRFIDKLFDKIILNHSNNLIDCNDINSLQTISECSVDDELLLSLKGKQKTIGFGGN